MIRTNYVDILLKFSVGIMGITFYKLCLITIHYHVGFFFTVMMGLKMLMMGVKTSAMFGVDQNLYCSSLERLFYRHDASRIVKKKCLKENKTVNISKKYINIWKFMSVLSEKRTFLRYFF